MASSEESSGRKAEKFMKKAERLKCYNARDAYWKCLDGFEEYAKSGNIKKEIPQEVVAHTVFEQHQQPESVLLDIWLYSPSSEGFRQRFSSFTKAPPTP